MIIRTEHSRHTFHVAQVPVESVPKPLQISGCTKFYEVRNFDAGGCLFFYLGKDNPKAKREILAWYGKHLTLWHGYGTTLKSAIEGAQRDGWLHA